MRLLALPTSILLVLQLFPFTLAQNSSSPTTSTTSPSVSASSSSTNSSTQSGSATASAMFPSLSGYSTCVTDCLSTAIAAANCTSVVAVDCFCSSSKFVPSYINCTTQGCPAELQTAENLSEQFCAVANPSTFLSFSITSVSISSSSARSSSSSSSPSSSSTTTTLAHTSTAPASTTSSAAIRRWEAGVDGNLLCLVVAVFGMITGALCM